MSFLVDAMVASDYCGYVRAVKDFQSQPGWRRVLLAVRPERWVCPSPVEPERGNREELERSV